MGTSRSRATKTNFMIVTFHFLILPKRRLVTKVHNFSCEVGLFRVFQVVMTDPREAAVGTEAHDCALPGVNVTVGNPAVGYALVILGSDHVAVRTLRHL